MIAAITENTGSRGVRIFGRSSRGIHSGLRASLLGFQFLAIPIQLCLLEGPASEKLESL